MISDVARAAVVDDAAMPGRPWRVVGAALIAQHGRHRRDIGERSADQACGAIDARDGR